MALLDDLRMAQRAVTDVESTKGVVDSLIELGEGALGYVELAREQVKEQAPEVAARAEELIVASKRHLPKAAAVLGGVLVAGAIVGGVVLWQRRSGTELAEVDELALAVEESELPAAAQEAADEAADAVGQAADDIADEVAKDVQAEDAAAAAAEAADEAVAAAEDATDAVAEELDAIIEAEQK